MNEPNSTRTCTHCKSEISARASKCPHCTGDLRGWGRRHSKLVFLLAVFIIMIGFGAVISGDKEPTTSKPLSPTPTPKIVTDEQKTILAQSYCNNHRETLHLPDFTADGMPPINKKDSFSRHFEQGTALTQDDCLGVINVMLKHYDLENVQRIAEAKIWAGMSASEAELSVGMPNDINDTVSASKTHEQWVYHSDTKSSYLYFDGSSKDDRKLTSWQNW